MTTEAASAAGEAGGKGLKTNAIGYISNVVIGVASTAPGYGTSGEGPIKGVLLGSTAYKLLHVSDRPVVVVPG
jgi:hypothetical protein